MRRLSKIANQQESKTSNDIDNEQRTSDEVFTINSPISISFYNKETKSAVDLIVNFTTVKFIKI